MKKQLIVIFILWISQIFGQSTKNGVITYRINVSEQSIREYQDRRDKIKNKEALRFWDNFYVSSNYTKSVLKFQGVNSFYQVNKKLNNEAQNNMTTIDIFAGNKRVYFVDFFKKVTLAQDCDLIGECYLIENNFLDWQMTQKFKIIKGYKSYLAIAKIQGKKQKTINAWYTNEIPTNFGPMIYSGLPGLILELDDGSISYSVEKIQLNLKKKIKIEEKKKAPLVSKEDFVKTAKKYFPKELFKN